MRQSTRHLLKRILNICDKVKMAHFPVNKMCGKKCQRIKKNNTLWLVGWVYNVHCVQHEP